MKEFAKVLTVFILAEVLLIALFLGNGPLVPLVVLVVSYKIVHRLSNQKKKNTPEAAGSIVWTR
jgi:hypothetical protein